MKFVAITGRFNVEFERFDDNRQYVERAMA
jgi:hypothetical protein